jgi:hypothetical protein
MVVCERFLVGREKYKIEAILIDSGRDLTLWIGGGTSPHVGAIALGIPRPSLEDPDITSASVSVLCLTGHKEDDWARKLAHHLAKEFNKPIVVTLGIHIDNITQVEMELIRESFDNLVEQVVAFQQESLELKSIGEMEKSL